MKKFLLVLTLLIALTLSGCTAEEVGDEVPSVGDYEQCYHIPSISVFGNGSYECDGNTLSYEAYQDYKEVDYYTQEEIDTLLTNYYTTKELDDGIERFADEVIERLEALENEQQIDIDYEVSLYSLAIINIEILAYEKIENPSEEETLYYELLLGIYEMIENELEELE